MRAVPCVLVGCVADLLRVWAQAIVAAKDCWAGEKKAVASEEWHSIAWQRKWMSVWE